MSTFLFRGGADLRMARLLRPADGPEAARPAARRLASAAKPPPAPERPHDSRGAPAALVRPGDAGARRLRAEGDAGRARGAPPRTPPRAVRRRQHLDVRANAWPTCAAAAAGLQRLGVKKGDRVAAWLPTGRPMVLTWFAANYLGAVFVPLNTAYRGDVLAHVVNARRVRP